MFKVQYPGNSADYKTTIYIYNNSNTNKFIVYNAMWPYLKFIIIITNSMHSYTQPPTSKHPSINYLERHHSPISLVWGTEMLVIQSRIIFAVKITICLSTFNSKIYNYEDNKCDCKYDCWDNINDSTCAGRHPFLQNTNTRKNNMKHILCWIV